MRSLVVRRGQAFDLDLNITGCEFNAGTDRLQLLFSAGKTPVESKGTLVNVRVAKDAKSVGSDKEKWQAHIVTSSKSRVTVRVTSTAEAIVSAYAVTVKLFVVEAGEEMRHVVNIRDDIYLLFNPWNAGALSNSNSVTSLNSCVSPFRRPDVHERRAGPQRVRLERHGSRVHGDRCEAARTTVVVRTGKQTPAYQQIIATHKKM